jgi:hypothetical protein
VSTQAQNAILLINREHRQKGLFAVELFTWDRLDELLEEFTTIRDQEYGTLSGEVARQVQSGLSEIKLQLTDLGTQVVSTTQEAADGLHQEIDEARDLVRSEKWMIVEDAPNPDISREEYGPDHTLSRAMMGKKVGERVILSASSLGERAATIRAITSKYVFRFQDSMRNWQIRFPDVAGLQTFKAVRTNKEGKEEFDPSPLILSIEQLAGNLQRLKELYVSTPMAIHMFAAARDKGTIQTTLYLAQQEDVGVSCCIGTTAERSNALAALDTSGTWIIEPSALATIFLLDLADF